jgi:hypothetical protein
MWPPPVPLCLDSRPSRGASLQRSNLTALSSSLPPFLAITFQVVPYTLSPVTHCAGTPAASTPARGYPADSGGQAPLWGEEATERWGSDSLVLCQVCRVYAEPVPADAPLLHWANLIQPVPLHRGPDTGGHLAPMSGRRRL